MITNFGTEFTDEVKKRFPTAEIIPNLFTDGEEDRYLRGYHIKLNGITCSIQFSRYSYCDNYVLNNMDNYLTFTTKLVHIHDPEWWKCPNAEIAHWYTNTRKWITFEDGDEVNGYQTAEDVLAWLEKVSTYPNEA